MTEKEFNEYVNLYADALFRFIVKNIRHEEDARDIVQNSFEILWKQRQQVLPGKVKSYLFTVGYHNMIDHLRKTKKITLVDVFEDDGQIVRQKHVDAKTLLEKGLNRLNEVQRSLVMLKDYEGYSYEEIAQITHLNVSQVKVYLHRARLSLKNFIVKKENVI